MAINANVLSFVAGAAEQFTKNKDEFKKELRENKRRQRDWMNTYGNKVLNESKQKEEAVTSALKDLESRGLKQPDVLQLMQRHGVDAVLDLKKYVTEYEDKNNTTVDADLMNKIWKAADDFTLTSDNYGDAVSKVFGTNKAGATAPVIQEAEERSFFDKLKDNLSGAYEDEEYADFLDDPTEGIGNQSINDLRRMAAASPSMLGTEGAAVFDRSQLRGSESTTSERASWNELKGTILSNALNSLDPTVAESIRFATAETTSGVVSRNDDEQWNMLTGTNAPEAYKEAIAEATRNAAQGIKLGSNRAAWNSYGGQDALNAILNPPEPLTPKELAEQLEQDLIDNNLTGARPEDIGEKTDVEIVEWFERNNKDFTISDGRLIKRPDGVDFDATKVVTPVPVEDTEVQEPQDERIKTAADIASVKPRPLLTKGPDAAKIRSEWNKKYKGKYNPKTGEAIIVEKRPTEAPTSNRPIYLPQTSLAEKQNTWDRKYRNTHYPLTGLPLGAKFAESAEAAE